MQIQNTYYPFEDHLIHLIQTFNPLQSQSITKNLILLTCLHQTNISDIPFLQKQANSKSINPTLVIHQHNVDLVNSKRYLFAKEQSTLSCLNLMYFLTFYHNVKIIIAINQTDILQQSSNRFLQILSILEANISLKSKESEQFFSCIGFAIKETNQKHNTSHYVQKLQQIETAGLSKQATMMLKKIIESKSLIIHSQALTEQEFLEQVSDSKICGFETNPKRLTGLFKGVLKEQYFKSTADAIFESKNSYKAQLDQLIDGIAKQIFNMKIFDEDINIRRSVTNSILAKSPLGHIADKISYLGNNSQSVGVAQFVIQAIISTFQTLSLKHSEFQRLNKATPYSQFNKSNESYVDLAIDNNIENQSFISIILQSLFNEQTPLFDKEMMALSKYFHICLRLFQNFPLAKVREMELSVSKKFREIINQYLIDYFLSCLNPTISKLSDEANSYEGKRFLSLTKDTQILAHIISNSKQEIEAIPEKRNFIMLSFIRLSWKCYEKFKGVWTPEKKNDFMLDQIHLYYQNLDYLKAEFKSETLKILKEVHKYFGGCLQREKSYILAAKFYEASNINSKIIECYRLYFAYCMTTGRFEYEDIEQGVRKLAHLGLISQSLSWLQKFRERIEDFYLFSRTQEDIMQLYKKDNHRLFQEFVKLEYHEIKMVDKKCLALLKGQLKTRDWKESFRELFCSIRV